MTGRLYRDDPAILSWQLANEPRPGGSDEAGRRHMKAYLAWIDATARLIKSLDPNHMVSTGSEGTMGCINDVQCVVDSHSSPAIDYVNAHVWPQNWEWANPKDLVGTWPTVERKTHDYIAQQIGIARRLSKPLVIEEFGFPRDGGSFEPGTPTTFKERYYQLIFPPSSRACARARHFRDAISGVGAAKAGRFIPTIISCAVIPAMSPTHRTSHRAGSRRIRRGQIDAEG